MKHYQMIVMTWVLATLSPLAYGGIEYACENGRVTLPSPCTGVPGLEDYINGSPLTPDNLGQSSQSSNVLRECARGVRIHNMNLKKESKNWCQTADDQAFKLIMKVGSEEVRAYQNWQAGQQGPAKSEVVFHNGQCFGSICYQSSFHGNYRPFQSATAPAGAAK